MSKNLIQQLARHLRRRLHSPAAKVRHRRLFMEQLESRRVLADVNANNTANHLIVNGTTGDDDIFVDIDNGIVRVFDHGNPIPISGPHTDSDIVQADISAQAGNDTVTIDSSFGARPGGLAGQDGDDTLTAGSSFSILLGGDGNDVLIGSDDIYADYLDGGAGNDHLYADAVDASGGQIFDGSGTDILDFSGETANVSFTNSTTNAFETIYGGAGNDTLSNGSVTAAVSILGGDGNDTLTGGAGNDSLSGGAGNDYLIADISDGSLLGGSGFDWLDFALESSRVFFSNTTTTALEAIFGGSGNDVLNTSAYDGGAAGGVVLLGNGGDDTLTGGDGNDDLRGGSGNDTLAGTNGNDTLRGEAGTDFLSGGCR